MSRDRLTIRLPSERELLLEEFKDELGIEQDSKAIDRALEMALDYNDFLQEERQGIRDRAERVSGRHTTLKVRTDVTNK